MSRKIITFSGRYEFLSNFYVAPFTENDITYPTVEHYYQAAKTCDPKEYVAIACAPSPAKAKKLGKQCKMRENWEEIKMSVMEHALILKFQNPNLQQELCATGDAILIEANVWHDNFWGVCTCAKCQAKQGKNKLGFLLMKVRDKYLNL